MGNKKKSVDNNKKTRPNCYKCKYRGTVPGSAHSCCNYPRTVTGTFDFFNKKNIKIAQKLNIKGNSQGIRGGWFLWPVDFDPTWLENCDGFKIKE